MKHLFVSYEIAKQLKEKKFCVYKNINGSMKPPPDEEKCFAWYEERTKEDECDIPNWEERHKKLHIGSPKINANLASGVVAPTYQQVVDWLESNHGIDIYTYKRKFAKEVVWASVITDKYGLDKIITTDNNQIIWFNGKYEALIKAIEEAIKLI